MHGPIPVAGAVSPYKINMMGLTFCSCETGGRGGLPACSSSQCFGNSHALSDKIRTENAWFDVYVGDGRCDVGGKGIRFPDTPNHECMI